MNWVTGVETFAIRPCRTTEPFQGRERRLVARPLQLHSATGPRTLQGRPWATYFWQPLPPAKLLRRAKPRLADQPAWDRR